ncbi:MAG: YaeQ family protein [Labilithrix sp.]|nr:YaeQ family protein [Labilithrix sp.]MCW5832301.1 YaeQ family protein [Labilithrix sp.]
MALTATVHHFEVSLSDVDRGVYASLDFRAAQHPSETTRWLLTRTLAYCLSYEDGIAFSKGGLSSTDEPPIAIRDATGRLVWWIDVGAPSAERLHKASKSARVAVYTHDLAQLRRQTEGRDIYEAEAIEVWSLDPSFLDALAAKVGRRTRLELTRTDGALYVAIDGVTLETTLTRTTLSPEA